MLIKKLYAHGTGIIDFDEGGYCSAAFSLGKIENADVYCLTAEYLGNFVVDTSDTDSNIFSGVVEANCADFFFTFAWYNYHNAHCLYGPAPRPYQKKTNRPPRNPQGIPGVCKHIYNAWEILRNSGLTIN